MRQISYMFFVVLLGLLGSPAQAAHTSARLLLDSSSARAGTTIWAAVQLRMDSGWHTYWKNSGDSGMPTSVAWQLPPGVTAGDIQWPPPEKLSEQDLTTYIYKEEVALLVPLTLASNVPSGTLELKANVSWLECAVECVPGKAQIEARLLISSEAKPSSDAALLNAWRKRLPSPANDLDPVAAWDGPPKGDERAALLSWKSPTAVGGADFYPESGEGFEVQGQTERVGAGNGQVSIRKQVKTSSGKWPTQLSGLLIQAQGAQTTAYHVNVPIGAGTAVAAVTPAHTPTPAGTALPLTASLWQMLLYAFIGGLILNFMPCVLPVIALKILGFVGQAKEDPRRARRLGLIYALGVLVSFGALAGLVVGLKAAGHKAGWGIQFGNAYFLLAMTTLATLIALNLFGVFEVHLGGRTLTAAAGLSSRHGAAGAFFNGLLATVLATSCTAPFLGAAIGFAFAPSQTALITLVVFLMIGVGLALPYVVLTWQPGWLKFLPKPGAWMERFKVVMGFPMLAAAVWLFSLVSLHYGDRSWWLVLFLVFVAAAAWIYGEFVQRNRAHPAIASSVVLGTLALGYFFVLEGHLRWREPAVNASSSELDQKDPKGIAWKPWSSAAVAQAQAEGHPVVVDFTAKWCLTCNTIVKPALESASVREKIRELDAVALLGDYTAFPDAITEELNRFGRAGVPLVLVYPKNPGQPPLVLPEALTPGTIIRALDEISR